MKTVNITNLVMKNFGLGLTAVQTNFKIFELGLIAVEIDLALLSAPVYLSPTVGKEIRIFRAYFIVV